MKRLTTIAATTVLLVALSGCATTGGGMTESPSPSSSSGRPSFQTMPPLNPSGTATELNAAKMAAITSDLAGRGVTGTITVIKSEAVTWSDGSLGCPEAGKVYTQALVAGMHVIVSVSGKKYDYRFGGTDTPKLCKATK
jgi:hypothetical protein